MLLFLAILLGACSSPESDDSREQFLGIVPQGLQNWTGLRKFLYRGIEEVHQAPWLCLQWLGASGICVAVLGCWRWFGCPSLVPRTG
jgi:hypothetical protein